jgi:DNA primase
MLYEVDKLSNFYSDELIEEIRNANDIVDIVNEYVTLERKGAYFFGLCPFHAEKSPSFSVSPSKQIFYCFGCGKGGNVLQFVMNVEALDFKDSIKMLAEKAKIQLPENSRPEDEEKEKQKLILEEITRESARFYFKMLISEQGKEALLYLENRKISSKTIKSFGLGFSPKGFDKLYRHLSNAGFDDDIILKSGLVIISKNNKFIDRFRERIMFPIFDIRGRIIGFGGRVMDDSMPKYMNSPETALYSKGKQLYAMNFAKHSCKDKVLVVEGYMDVISLHQAGFTNVVAALGTALTENQGRLLKKYTDEIIICFDADSAGQAATLKGLDLLDSIGCKVKVLSIPDGKDPDEFIKNNGREAFEAIINKSVTLADYKLNKAKNSINTESMEGKISFLDKASDILSKMDNQLERELYMNKLSSEYGISLEALMTEIVKKAKKTIESSQKKTNQRIKSNETKLVKKSSILEKNEKLLLCMLSIDNKAFKVLEDKLRPEDFSNSQLQFIAENLFEKLKNGHHMQPADLLNLVNPELSSEFAKIISGECVYEDISTAVMDIIKRMEIEKLETLKQGLLEQINNFEKSNLKIEGDVEQLNRELNVLINQIRTKKQSLNNKRGE